MNASVNLTRRVAATHESESDRARVRFSDLLMCADLTDLWSTNWSTISDWPRACVVSSKVKIRIGNRNLDFYKKNRIEINWVLKFLNRPSLHINIQNGWLFCAGSSELSWGQERKKVCLICKLSTVLTAHSYRNIVTISDNTSRNYILQSFDITLGTSTNNIAYSIPWKQST